MTKTRRVYMDHAATTPMAPEVWDAMAPYATETFGNASSLHSFGREARRALDFARGQVASLLHTSPDQIIFTSGGTESDNFALCGVAFARKDSHRHIITSSIEHHAVLETCHHLESFGFLVTYLPVDEFGRVNPEDVAAAIRPDTALVSIMAANNEIGTLQPIREIGRITRAKGVLFHTDAVQACGILPMDVESLGVDLLSLSGHKLYGPKGIGSLFVRKGVPMVPLHHGGEQERKRRGGTENVPAAVGLGKACEMAAQRLEEESRRLVALRERLVSGVLTRIEGSRLLGHPEMRLPGNASFAFQGGNSQSLLIHLDLAGIAASNGSACASGSAKPSHVMPAIGLELALARSAIRLSLGRSNDEADVDTAVEQLCLAMAQIREAGQASMPEVEMNKGA